MAGRKEIRQELSDSKMVYDEQADAFANKAPQLLTWEFIGEPTLRRLLKEPFKKSKNIKVLNIGSGTGRNEKLFIEMGVKPENITGVEISPNEVKIAKRDVPGVDFRVGDARNVELPTKKYDIATSYMVWEFLDHEGLDQAFANVYDSLKPGGLFVYGTTHPGRYVGKYGVTEEGWVETAGPWNAGAFNNWYREVETFVEASKKAGFEVDIAEELDMPDEAGEKYPERIKEFNSFGAPVRLFVVAHKPVK